MKITVKPEPSWVAGAMISKSFPVTGSLSETEIEVSSDTSTDSTDKTESMSVIVGTSVA